ncbi:pseudouridine synthase [Demequina muriae]|uniref:Pseudouridine synthase n=1 Tax=Demequina muriae TaxID=3051664 RepID=A0ABT8GKK3_9MICO|nr:pseudouridine synthase [Demequina sp. EGI L300058]MDN4481821.1 pseudouridine synthase [Demequina sp. EGI L300058]
MDELEVHRPEGVRLQKVLAAAGVGSRRKCEILIERGLVKVNGEVVDQLGVRVNPDEVTIEVKGQRISVDDSKVVVVLNKPAGVVSTMSDPQGRRSLDEFVADFEERLFHVGRLDAETTGVLLLTNDGDLANRLAHPSHGVPKVYVAKVEGRVPKSLCTMLRAGVDLDDGPVRVTDCAILDARDDASLVKVELHEGRNRIVRRMLDKAGHPVIDLVRTDFGPISLGTLQPGQVRRLGREEVGSLMKVAGL